MPRDYKKRSRKKNPEQPASIGSMLLGLAVGLTVALWVYLYDRRAEPAPDRPAAADRQPASAAIDAADDVEEEDRFSFYEMLPNFEVVIPEMESSARVDTRAEPITEPGQYVLQAGSFKNFPDADRMQATLAMLGLESRLQKVTIDNNAWHRVRLGPYTDLDRLNSDRELLRRNQIEVIRIRVGD